MTSTRGLTLTTTVRVVDRVHHNTTDGGPPALPAQLNTYDVLNADDVVFSVEALNDFINRRQNTASAGVAAAAAAAEEEK